MGGVAYRRSSAAWSPLQRRRVTGPRHGATSIAQPSAPTFR